MISKEERDEIERLEGEEEEYFRNLLLKEAKFWRLPYEDYPHG